MLILNALLLIDILNLFFRNTIAEEEQQEIFAEVDSQLHQMELARKKMKRKRSFVKPKKTA